MSDIILGNIKTVLGIEEDNLGFDHELLIHINSAKSGLVQLDVTALDIVIDASTVLPDTGSTSLDALCVQYLGWKVKQAFDPSANASIASALDKSLITLEGRIQYEVEEIENAVP